MYILINCCMTLADSEARVWLCWLPKNCNKAHKGSLNMFCLLSAKAMVEDCKLVNLG